MKALFLTNEYPPHVYGGAGVHVEYLSRELSRLIPVEVRCFGDQKVSGQALSVTGFQVPEGLTEATPKELRSPIGTLARCVAWNAAPAGADVVHCHTWYSHMGGILTKLLYGSALVITTHSLEPLRPWKREQLGRGYDFSSWVERTALEMADAVIAVSEETKRDILQHFNVAPEKDPPPGARRSVAPEKDPPPGARRSVAPEKDPPPGARRSVAPDRVHVIPNGIDTEEYRRVEATDQLERYGVPPDLPYVLFVGRIARQKGIIHLVRAIQHLDPEIGVVLCAGAPDTEEIAREMEQGVERGRKGRENVHWIREMVPKEAAIQLYSHARVFCCPSIYEPFGIINLEAMACGTPVVASAVGGIKEVVLPEETGLLVPFDQQTEPPFEASDPDRFARDLAAALNRVAGDEALGRAMGEAGRRRAEQTYSWRAIAAQVLELYRSLLREVKA
jgi:glycosyltransferase involved in cell wall biosynthesis